VPFPPRLGRPEEYAQTVLDLCRNVMSMARSSASTARFAWRPARKAA